MSTVSVPQASTTYTLSSLQALKTHCPQQLSPDVWVNGGEKAQSRNGCNDKRSEKKGVGKSGNVS